MEEELDTRPEDIIAITPKIFAGKKDSIRKLLKTKDKYYLEHLHALSHSINKEYGDIGCQVHFLVAMEMSERRMYHSGTSVCDRVVELIKNWRTYTPTTTPDPVLRDDWRIVHAWIRKVCKDGNRFDSEQFKDMNLKEQQKAIRNLRDKIRNEMVKRGWKPKALADLPPKFNFDDITVQYVNKISDEDLKDIYRKVHEEYENRGRITEDLLNANIKILTEMYKRGIIDESYENKDKLDEESRFSWEEYPVAPKLSGEITLKEILDIFSRSGLAVSSHRPVAYLCGRIVNENKIPSSHDIDILFKTPYDKELVLAIKNIIPTWLFNKLHFVWDPKGPDIGKSVPVYFMSLSPISKDKMTIGFKTRELSELKPGKPFIHLKPKSGYDKYEFWDPTEAWSKWGSQHISNGILVEEKVDGRNLVLHYSPSVIQMVTEDTHRDRASQFPEIQEEVKKLRCKECILDGEMLEFEDNIEGKNAEAKRQMNLIPREDTASITTGDIDEQERKRIVYVFYDLVYLDGEDWSQKSAEERYRKLREIIPINLKYIDCIRGELAYSVGQYNSLISKYRSVSGSEGVVMKDAKSLYTIKYFGENRTGDFANIKNLKEIDVKVLDITSKKEKATGKSIDTWMYTCYYEVPSNRKDEFVPEDIKEYEGKTYARIGISYGSGQNASIGDIVTIKPIRIRKYMKNNKIRYTWMFPYFKEIRKGKNQADTLTTVERLEKLGTRPSTQKLNELSEEDFNIFLEKGDRITIKLDKCPFYKNKLCPLKDRYESPYLSIVFKEHLKHPIDCILAQNYRCRYVKDYYYEEGKIGELSIEDGDTIKKILQYPLRLKKLELQKYLEMPTGVHPFVMQSHQIGDSQHMDFRMQVNGYLVGWSIVGGNINAQITPEELLTRKDRGFRAEEKEQQPLGWLKVNGELKPGTVGGGIEKPGRMTILTEGDVVFGVQKPYFHEYFVKDGKYFKDWNRIVVRAIRTQTINPETKEKTKFYERMWRALIADPMPYTISHRAIKEGWKPPKSNQTPFPEEWTKSTFKEQYEKWKEYIGSRELSKIPFTFSMHSYRGPIHKRAAWRRVWYLFLDDEGSNTVRTFRLPDFPLEGAVSAYDEGRDKKKYMILEGWTKPSTRFNPNRKVIGEMKILSKGGVDIDYSKLESGEEVISLRFLTGILQGNWKLIQEDKGTDTYTFEKT